MQLATPAAGRSAIEPRPDPRIRDAAALRGRVTSPARLSEEECRSWRALAAMDGLDHPFLSPGFSACVARVRRGVRVCVLRQGGRIVGFLPFQRVSGRPGWLGLAEPVGGRMSDRFGLVAAPGCWLPPAALLRAAGLHALEFHHLGDEQLRFGLTGGGARIGHRLMLGRDPADYWARLKAANPSFLAELRRRERRLVEQHGPLRFELAVADPQAGLSRLVARKRAQYRESGVPDALAAGWKRRLLAALAASGDPDCRGVLTELHAGETWVASHFGLRNRHTLHYWFPAYNPALAKLAPGHLLLRLIIEHGMADGIAVIDRGEGDQPHKTSWPTEPRWYHRGLWRRPTARGLAGQAGLALAWRLAALGRRAA
ncbi:MAG: GNAT family N-acetyltransferase [Dongiaceae bacterium]